MKKKTIIIVLLSVLLLTAMSCMLTDLIGGGNDEPEEDEAISSLSATLTAVSAQIEQQEEEEEELQPMETAVPTNTPLPTAPPLPTNTPMPTYTPVPSNPGMITELDYHTDFSFSDGWYDYYISPINYPEYTIDFGAGRARVTIETEDTYVYMVQEDLYYYEGEAVYVETTISANEGAYNNNLGVICRVSEEGWYEFLIRSNGYWDFYIYESGEGYTVLDTGGSWNIKMKHEENTVGMLCDGDKFTVYINGVETKVVRNNTLLEGSVGLNVGTLEWGGVEFDVKNFIAVNDLSLVNLPD